MKEGIRNGEKIPRQVNEALHDFAGAQRQELRSLKAQIPDPDSINLFEWYKKDGRFGDTYHTAMGYALVPGLNWAGSRNLEENFAGITFENIAFTVCALKENSNGIVVLSPTRTKELFKYVYPNAPRVDFPFREDSLGGDASVPNGIGTDESDLTDNTILNIYEYTLSGKKQVFDEKYDLFKQKKRKFPQIFPNASLVFVVPKSAILPNVNASNIRFMETNFTRSDFNDFMTEIYCNYTVRDDIPTLETVKGWKGIPSLEASRNNELNRTCRYFFDGIN